MNEKNLHTTTVAGFGDEWERFDQSELPTEERQRIFNRYFSIFPWQKLPENAERLGEIFRYNINQYIKTSKIIKLVRGKGLLNAIVINDAPDSKTAWNICLKLKDSGLLAKPTHGNIIRFAPPLIINKEQLNDCIDIIITSLKDFE